MTEQQLPKQWSHERIQDAIRFHENQSGAEAVVEMATAIAEGRAFRTVLVPVELEDQVLMFIKNLGGRAMPRSNRAATVVAENRKGYE
jgi:hypothetical protein